MSVPSKLAYKAIFSHCNNSKSKYVIKYTYNIFENKRNSHQFQLGTFYLINTGDIKTKRQPKMIYGFSIFG